MVMKAPNEISRQLGFPLFHVNPHAVIFPIGPDQSQLEPRGVDFVRERFHGLLCALPARVEPGWFGHDLEQRERWSENRTVAQRTAVHILVTLLFWFGDL